MWQWLACKAVELNMSAVAITGFEYLLLAAYHCICLHRKHAEDLERRQNSALPAQLSRDHYNVTTLQWSYHQSCNTIV